MAMPPGDAIRQNAGAHEGVRDRAPVRQLKVDLRGTACVGMADDDEPCPFVAIEAIGELADIGLGAFTEPKLAVVEQPSCQCGTQTHPERARVARHRNGEWYSLGRDFGEYSDRGRERPATATLPFFVLVRNTDHSLERWALDLERRLESTRRLDMGGCGCSGHRRSRHRFGWDDRSLNSTADCLAARGCQRRDERYGTSNGRALHLATSPADGQRLDPVD